jgi:hypothetical protein
MQNTFITFTQFIKPIMEEQRARYMAMSVRFKGKEVIPSIKTLESNYFITYGFVEWLESIKHVTLTVKQVRSIALTYINLGEREIRDIPSILASISRIYDVEIPACAGIMTPSYWEAALLKKKELIVI